jgi:hypothetical protein
MTQQKSNQEIPGAQIKKSSASSKIECHQKMTSHRLEITGPPDFTQNSKFKSLITQTPIKVTISKKHLKFIPQNNKTIKVTKSYRQMSDLYPTHSSFMMDSLILYKKHPYKAELRKLKSFTLMLNQRKDITDTWIIITCQHIVIPAEEIRHRDYYIILQDGYSASLSQSQKQFRDQQDYRSIYLILQSRKLYQPNIQ